MGNNNNQSATPVSKSQLASQAFETVRSEEVQSTGWLAGIGASGAPAPIQANRGGDGNVGLAWLGTGLYKLIDSFANVGAISGDLSAVSPNVVQTNISARSFIYEPGLLDTTTRVHSPYKSTLQPWSASFDASGNTVQGASTGTSYSIATSLVSGGTLGFAIRITAKDVLNSNCELSVTSPAGFSAKYKLRDISREGWIVILNHTTDTSVDIVPASTFNTPTFDIAFTPTSTAQAQQFTFSNSGPASNAPWVVRGQNCNFDLYPIVNSRENYALVQGLYYADKTDYLASAFMMMYADLITE